MLDHIKTHYPQLLKPKNKDKALLKIRAYMLSKYSELTVQSWLNDKAKLSIINYFVNNSYNELLKLK